MQAQVDALLRRFEKLSADIRERELELGRLARERDQVRAMLRTAAIQGDAGDPTREHVAALIKKAPTSTERRTVELIRRSGQVVDRTWLAKALDITVDAASIRLARCHQKGLLERPQKGRYFAPSLNDRTLLLDGEVPEVQLGMELPKPVDGADPAFESTGEVKS